MFLEHLWKTCKVDDYEQRNYGQYQEDACIVNCGHFNHDHIAPLRKTIIAQTLLDKWPTPCNGILYTTPSDLLFSKLLLLLPALWIY